LLEQILSSACSDDRQAVPRKRRKSPTNRRVAGDRKRREFAKKRGKEETKFAVRLSFLVIELFRYHLFTNENPKGERRICILQIL